MRDRKITGFSLLELMIVVIMISIFSMAALVGYQNYAIYSQFSVAMQELGGILNVVMEGVRSTGFCTELSLVGDGISTGFLQSQYFDSYVTGGKSGGQSCYVRGRFRTSNRYAGNTMSTLWGKTLQLQILSQSSYALTQCITNVPAKYIPSACEYSTTVSW